MRAQAYQTNGSVPCHLYVDAKNVRIPLEEKGLSNRFDPRKLKDLVERESIGGRRIIVTRVFFYDTIDPRAPHDVERREEEYLDRIERLPDIHVCKGYTGGSGKQKTTDVQLAVDAVEAALSGRVGAVAIASGDGDFLPVADAIRRAGPHVLVLSFENSLSPELRDAADRVIPLPDKPKDWALEGC